MDRIEIAGPTRGGDQQTLACDANGHLASVADSFGRRLRFIFANGVLQTMTNPDGWGLQLRLRHRRC